MTIPDEELGVADQRGIDATIPLAFDDDVALLELSAKRGQRVIDDFVQAKGTIASAPVWRANSRTPRTTESSRFTSRRLESTDAAADGGRAPRAHLPLQTLEIQLERRERVADFV